MRSQLPENLPPQVFHEGFALIEVRVTNAQAGEWSFHPDQITVRNPKGKELVQAAGKDIAPKLIGYYRGGRPLYGVEAYSGSRIPRQTRVDSRRDPTQKGANTIAVTLGQELRDLFDSHRLQPAALGPGESAQGFLYVKSKKSGARLRGGLIEFPGGIQAEIR